MSQKLKIIVGFALSIFLVACVLAYLAVGWSGFDKVLCLLYTSPSPRDRSLSRMPSSA